MSGTPDAPPINKTWTAQRDALPSLGVEPDRIYVDHGLTGANRERPGLREALAACRAGDTLVVTKLDRLARSLPDARAIADVPDSPGRGIEWVWLAHRAVRPPGRAEPTRTSDCMVVCYPLGIWICIP